MYEDLGSSFYCASKVLQAAAKLLEYLPSRNICQISGGRATGNNKHLTVNKAEISYITKLAVNALFKGAIRSTICKKKGLHFTDYQVI